MAVFVERRLDFADVLRIPVFDDSSAIFTGTWWKRFCCLASVTLPVVSPMSFATLAKNPVASLM